MPQVDKKSKEDTMNKLPSNILDIATKEEVICVTLILAIFISFCIYNQRRCSQKSLNSCANESIAPKSKSNTSNTPNTSKTPNHTSKSQTNTSTTTQATTGPKVESEDGPTQQTSRSEYKYEDPHEQEEESKTSYDTNSKSQFKNLNQFGRFLHAFPFEFDFMNRVMHGMNFMTATDANNIFDDVRRKFNPNFTNITNLSNLSNLVPNEAQNGSNTNANTNTNTNQTQTTLHATTRRTSFSTSTTMASASSLSFVSSRIETFSSASHTLPNHSNTSKSSKCTQNPQNSQNSQNTQNCTQNAQNNQNTQNNDSIPSKPLKNVSNISNVCNTSHTVPVPPKVPKHPNNSKNSFNKPNVPNISNHAKSSSDPCKNGLNSSFFESIYSHSEVTQTVSKSNHMTTQKTTQTTCQLTTQTSGSTTTTTTSCFESSASSEEFVYPKHGNFCKFREGLRWGHFETIGRRDSMQDCYRVVPKFHLMHGGDDKFPQSCFILFDGHQGDEASKFVCEYLPQHVANRIRQERNDKMSISPEGSNNYNNYLNRNLNNFNNLNNLNEMNQFNGNAGEMSGFERNVSNMSNMSEMSELSEMNQFEGNMEQMGEIGENNGKKRVETDEMEEIIDYEECIRKGFEDVEEGWKRRAQETKCVAGAVGIFVLIVGKDLYVANVGDTHGYLGRNQECITLTQDHTPENDAERTRCGSFIVRDRLVGRNRDDTSLNVTRAIGDYIWLPCDPAAAAATAAATTPSNETNICYKLEGLSSEPFISRTHLTSKDEFLILACDGLWDFFKKPRTAMTESRQMLRKKQTCGEVAQQLVKKAIDGCVDDNVSVIVIGFADIPDAKKNDEKVLKSMLQIAPPFPVFHGSRLRRRGLRRSSSDGAGKGLNGVGGVRMPRVQEVDRARTDPVRVQKNEANEENNNNNNKE